MSHYIHASRHSLFIIFFFKHSMTISTSLFRSHSRFFFPNNPQEQCAQQKNYSLFLFVCKCYFYFSTSMTD